MNTAKGISESGFRYLKDRFKEFSDFSDVIDLLQTTSLEVGSNKRWTSKFVFPYGLDCLYEDLDKNAKTNDRRFFGRTGEMLYLILSRSKEKARLAELLSEHLFFKDPSWNKIVRALQPTTELESGELRGGSFLPYPKNRAYDSLAEDWIALLELGIPGYDVFPYLVNLAGFHLVQYQLRVARDIAKITKPFKMVCEIVAPKKTLVREISCTDYQENNLISSQAVTAYIDSIERSEDWAQARREEDSFISCKELLEKKVLWGSKYDGANNPDALLDQLKYDAKKRHKQHVANIHRNYGRDIGLVSRRGTVRLRYAPNDGLIKAIIFSNVETRIELNQFLALIWNRYGLIFGDYQAEAVLPKDEFDKKAFQANAKRLEQRLASLGLLKRLSDGCAYVLNPFERSRE